MSSVLDETRLLDDVGAVFDVPRRKDSLVSCSSAAQIDDFEESGSVRQLLIRSRGLLISERPITSAPVTPLSASVASIARPVLAANTEDELDDNEDEQQQQRRRRRSGSRLSLKEGHFGNKCGNNTSASSSPRLASIPRLLRASFNRLIRGSKNSKAIEDTKTASSTCSSCSSIKEPQLTPDPYVDATLGLPVIPFALPTTVIAEKMEERRLRRSENRMDDHTKKFEDDHADNEESADSVSIGPSSLQNVVSLAQQEYLDELMQSRVARTMSTDEGYMAMSPVDIEMLRHQQSHWG